MILSILIPTTPERWEQTNYLIGKLTKNNYPVPTEFPHLTYNYNLQIDYEIIVCNDNKELSIGAKRNLMVQEAKGKYIVMVDSDDDVADDFVELILKTIKDEPELDCITWYELCTENGIEPRICNHDNKYKGWENGGDEEGIFYRRTPFCKDVILRDYYIQFPFEDIRFGEDHVQSNAMRHLCTKQVHINKIMYYYKAESVWGNFTQRYGGDKDMKNYYDTRLQHEHQQPLELVEGMKELSYGGYSNGNTVVVRHNAGFFSNMSIRLRNIIEYIADEGKLPEIVDSSYQFSWYKKANENLQPYYLKDCIPLQDIPTPKELWISTEQNDDKKIDFQWVDYRTINYVMLTPLLQKYFHPSDFVLDTIATLIQKYELLLDNTCAVFYRGNDKNREMTIAPYQMFIDKAKEVKERNPEIKFLVQPDEPAFLEAFLKEFPDSVYFLETPMCKDKQLCTVLELEQEERALFGARFFAAVLIMASCKEVIVHSGNGSFWLSLYRGNSQGVSQVRDNVWL